MDGADAQFERALAAKRRGAFDEAYRLLQALVAAHPAHALAHNLLGNLQQLAGGIGAAVACYERATAANPRLAEPWNNLGAALLAAGRTEAAARAWERAIALKPAWAGAHSNLLLAAHYHEEDGARLLRLHRAWAERHAPDTAPRLPRRAGGRLRIGYVSADFREHSVAYFAASLLFHHDRERFEVYCYADVAQEDAVTQALRAAPVTWRPVAGKSDEELAALVRADAIDILVDLAGHTGPNRLPVFARRPAPLQLTTLGYPGTTGMRQIDARITDALADPDGAEAWHTERLLRLPGGFLCYTPPASTPAPVAPPCLRAGHITFGSFNVPAKTSPATVRAWSAILDRVPGSRLLLKASALRDPAVRADFAARFAAHGVGADRLECLPRDPSTAAHLARYAQVDIALDPFPYHGTTTTCEALWMGVPVVTRAGRLHAGRVGVSILTQAGCAAWIAADDADYIERAVALAADPEALRVERAALRARLQASPLCDVRRYVREVEAAIEGLWYTGFPERERRNAAIVRYNRAVVHHERARHHEARAALMGALAIEPDFVEALERYALLLVQRGSHEESFEVLARLIALRPDVAEPRNLLGAARLRQGRPREARAEFHAALRLDPSHAPTWTNLLFALHYDDDTDDAEIAALHRRWGALHPPPAPPAPRVRAADEPLRIGYVSGDLSAHSVGWFMGEVLRHHDPARFAVHVYSNRVSTDPWAQELRTRCDRWRDIGALDDAAVVAAIRTDGIDVLVDLSGHTQGQRLAVFAQRAAPVQVTWLGYPDTTGLAQMDWRIVDGVTDPHDAVWRGTERPWRLDRCFLAWAPPHEDLPLPERAPVADAGGITFGSFNNPAKISDRTLALWARVLEAVPGSRLLCKGWPFREPEAQAWLRARCAAAGIAPGRIAFAPWVPRAIAHLQAWHQVDIALDTAPYNGTTTTCEALWMGVPVVVSGGGTRHCARVGESLLRAAGLDDWLARDADDYVRIAARLAADRDALTAWRRGDLRARISASALCDAPGLVRALEAAYTAMQGESARIRDPA